MPGLEGSAIKLHYSELYQRMAELGLRLLGRAALSREDVAGLPSRRFLHEGLKSLNATIAAGTSQIQRNIVAERILGLPREPRR
jgi:alkylation response protein AidB-like acyl-CoA dehydrogenase